MPRNPDSKRVEVLLSPEQDKVLKDYFEAEYPGVDLAEGIRRTLSWAIPSFGKAKPLKARGKYPRRHKYKCPECGSANTGYWNNTPEGEMYMCDDCEHAFLISK